MQSILDQLNFSARGKEGKFVVFQYQEGWGLGKNGNWSCWCPSKEIAGRALAAWGGDNWARRWCSKPSSQTRSKTSSQSSPLSCTKGGLHAQPRASSWNGILVHVKIFRRCPQKRKEKKEEEEEEEDKEDEGAGKRKEKDGEGTGKKSKGKRQKKQPEKNKDEKKDGKEDGSQWLLKYLPGYGPGTSRNYSCCYKSKEAAARAIWTWAQEDWPNRVATEKPYTPLDTALRKLRTTYLSWLSKQIRPEVLEQAREDLTGHILEPRKADDGLAQFWKIVMVFVETPISTQTNIATGRESLHFFPDQSVVDDQLPLDAMEKDVAVGFCS